ncbi:bacterioferritin-associated ferredoxin [Geothrix sp. 21YS21S-4]|uniref:(2Fe-2S)-binding protein n=1 Tax=Geothrix sp. 21YS21S-4 TaxID=3068889 RepID=UPI0027B93607|nr:(2Fe-2S)-binding protein [Geothrix sp. 21YS21S-4]
MFLCICSAITEDQVHWAVRERGADSAEAVFEILAARPDCFRCVASLEEAVLAVRAGEPVRLMPEPAAAGPATTPWGCGGRCRPSWGSAGIAKAS